MHPAKFRSFLVEIYSGGQPSQLNKLLISTAMVYCVSEKPGNLSTIFTTETTFVTSCWLSRAPRSFWKVLYPKKNLLTGESSRPQPPSPPAPPPPPPPTKHTHTHTPSPIQSNFDRDLSWKCINEVDFQPFCTRETTFETSWLLPAHQCSYGNCQRKKKGKNSLPGCKFFPFRFTFQTVG